MKKSIFSSDLFHLPSQTKIYTSTTFFFFWVKNISFCFVLFLNFRWKSPIPFLVSNFNLIHTELLSVSPAFHLHTLTPPRQEPPPPVATCGGRRRRRVQVSSFIGASFFMNLRELFSGGCGLGLLVVVTGSKVVRVYFAFSSIQRKITCIYIVSPNWKLNAK